MAEKNKIILDLGAVVKIHPDLTTVDVQRGADIVCNLSNGLPFKDRSVNRIISNHLIEHLSLPDGLALLKECHRVLKRGSTLTVITPDLYSIAIDYLIRGLNTQIINDNLYPEEGSSFFNRHLCCYDFRILGEYFVDAGFKEVKLETPGSNLGFYYENFYKDFEIREIKDFSIHGEYYTSNLTLQVSGKKTK